VISSKSISCDKLDTQSSSAINKVTNSNLFPSQYNCVIGVLQRIVLCVPDRAPMRSLAVESILKVVSALYDTYESTTGMKLLLLLFVDSHKMLLYLYLLIT
jgi:hypothetical protein